MNIHPESDHIRILQDSSSLAAIGTAAYVGLIILWVFSSLSCCLGTFCLIRCMLSNGPKRPRQMTTQGTAKMTNAANSMAPMGTKAQTPNMTVANQPIVPQQTFPNQTPYMMNPVSQNSMGNQVINNQNTTNGGTIPQDQQHGYSMNGIIEQNINASVNLNQSSISLLANNPETKPNLGMKANSVVFPHRTEYEQTDLGDDHPDDIPADNISRVKHISRDEVTKNHLEISQILSKMGNGKPKLVNLKSLYDKYSQKNSGNK